MQRRALTDMFSSPSSSTVATLASAASVGGASFGVDAVGDGVVGDDRWTLKWPFEAVPKENVTMVQSVLHLTSWCGRRSFKQFNPEIENLFSAQGSG